MQVCLFDIDGTLLDTGGAGMAAMIAGFYAEFGVNDPIHGISSAGRTDRAITCDVFEFHDLLLDDATYRRFLNTYLDLLSVELRRRAGRTLPGVRELLAALSPRSDLLLGLLTGNFRDAAWLKLQHFGLHGHFDFGGFGDRHTHRDDVAREAFAQIQRRLGSDIDPSDVWVIGDTPADIECARAIGANVVAVATGVYSIEELEDAGPDVLFADFSRIDRFLRLLDLGT